jgi:hypothetical protein
MVYTVRVPRPLRRRNVVSFRVDDLEWIRLQALKATFDENTWPPLFDWLFAQEEVQELVASRLKPRTLTEVLDYFLDSVDHGDEERPDSVRADIGYNS